MSETVSRSATYADIEALPENMVGEIIFGELVAQPRPLFRHGGAANALTANLTPPFQFGRGGPGGWVFVMEPELHLGPHVLVPDIAGWRNENVPAGLAERVGSERAPNWVLEVLSPSTEEYDRGDKRRIYATFGVDHLWLLDPRVQHLEVFARQDREWLLKADYTANETVCAPPFEAVSFPMADLFPFDAVENKHGDNEPSK